MGDNDEERKRMETGAEREAGASRTKAELLWCSLCLFGNARVDQNGRYVR